MRKKGIILIGILFLFMTNLITLDGAVNEEPGPLTADAMMLSHLL